MNLELCPLNPQKVGNEESQRFVILNKFFFYIFIYLEAMVLNKWIRRYSEQRTLEYCTENKSI